MQKSSKNFFVPWALLLCSIVLGVLLVVQFRIDKFSLSDDIVGNTEDAEAAADMLSLEQENLKTELSNLRDEIEDLASVNLSQADKDTLEKLKQDLALTEMTGSGIVITFRDSQNLPADAVSYEKLLVHAADLRDIVQKLWASGAKGISINGERLIATSPITCVGNSVLINDTRMVPPFEIVVIGDSGILAQSLNLEMYFPELAQRISDGDIEFSIKPMENLTIDVFDGDMSTNYIKQND